MMQRMSRGWSQWQLNANRLDCFNHVNHVSIRSNGQESLRSRTRSSTHVDIEQGFLKMVIFFKKIQMLIFALSLFCSMYSSSQKSSNNKFKAPIIFRKDFLQGFFGLDKLKNETTRKQNRKRKKKHNKRKQKSKRQLKDMVDFLFRKQIFERDFCEN